MSKDSEENPKKQTPPTPWYKTKIAQNFFSGIAVALVLGPAFGLAAFCGLQAARSNVFGADKRAKLVGGATVCISTVTAAAIGTAIFPGVGTIIGAAIGYFGSKKLAEKIVVPKMATRLMWNQPQNSSETSAEGIQQRESQQSTEMQQTSKAHAHYSSHKIHQQASPRSHSTIPPQSPNTPRPRPRSQSLPGNSRSKSGSFRKSR